MRFVTIVPHVENLELRKDTGQIPYQLYNLCGYDSTLVTYFFTLEGRRKNGPVNEPPSDKQTISENYPYLTSEVPGLKLHFLKNKGRGKFYEKAIFDYLLGNAKKIDVLNLFHFNAENIFYSIIYKFLNPKGRLYLKLDIDIEYYKSRKHFFNTAGPLANFKIFVWEKVIYRIFFKIAHTVSAESALGLDYFKSRFNVPEKKMAVIPNGIDAARVSAHIEAVKNFRQKENIILSVGRIGTPQKNNTMLLNALRQTDLNNWKVYFVGPIEDSFKKQAELILNQHPQLAEKVFFTGHITSPRQLYEFYNRAKIFCLTSVHEGFPLSACEAAFFGNYLILTDTIYAFNELTDKGRCGTMVELNNELALAQAIQSILNKEESLELKCDQIKAYAQTTLAWQKIIPTLCQRFTPEYDIRKEIL